MAQSEIVFEKVYSSVAHPSNQFKKSLVGDIYDTANGKTYSCKISFAGQNIKVRGYIGISLFDKTEIFERIH